MPHEDVSVSLRADRVKIALALIAALFCPSVARAWGHSPIYNFPDIRESWGGIEYLVWDPLPKTDELDFTSLEARDLRTGRQLWEVKLYDNKGKPNVDHYLPHVGVKSMGYTDGQIVVVNSHGDVIKVDASSGRILAGAGHFYYGDDEVDGHAWGKGLSGRAAIVIAGVLSILWITFRRRAFKAKG